MTDTVPAAPERTELQILVAVETLISEHELALGVEDRSGGIVDRLARLLDMRHPVETADLTAVPAEDEWREAPPAIRFTRVSYEHLKTLPGRYENERVSAEAEVRDGEDPDAVLLTLRQWVDGRLNAGEDAIELRERVSTLRYEAERHERRIEQAERRWAAILAFMEKLGIERPEDVPDSLAELPF